jgi:hypothetical protein
MKTRCSASQSRVRSGSARRAAAVGSTITSERYAPAALDEASYRRDRRLSLLAIAVDFLRQLHDRVLQLAYSCAQIVDVGASVLGAALLAAATLEDAYDILSHAHKILLASFVLNLVL